MFLKLIGMIEFIQQSFKACAWLNESCYVSLHVQASMLMMYRKGENYSFMMDDR